MSLINKINQKVDEQVVPPLYVRNILIVIALFPAIFFIVCWGTAFVKADFKADYLWGLAFLCTYGFFLFPSIDWKNPSYTPTIRSTLLLILAGGVTALTLLITGTIFMGYTGDYAYIPLTIQTSLFTFFAIAWHVSLKTT